jgi:hypothetical protein
MNRTSSAQGVSAKVSPAVIGCSILVISFFLPWVKIFGEDVPGYKISQLSSDWQWLWAIPIMSGLAVFLGLTGKKNTAVAQIAGALPLIGLAIGIYRLGRDLIPALLFGGWCALLCGFFLIVVAPRLVRKAEEAPPPQDESSGGDNQ